MIPVALIVFYIVAVGAALPTLLASVGWPAALLAAVGFMLVIGISVAIDTPHRAGESIPGRIMVGTRIGLELLKYWAITVAGIAALSAALLILMYAVL